LLAFDTVVLRVNDCYSYNQPVPIRQVTVLPTDDSVQLSWNQPAGLNPAFFNGYRIEMNDQLDGTLWQEVALVQDLADTLLDLATLDPESESRDFRVILRVLHNPDCPPGDSISNIWLRPTDGSLTNTDFLESRVAWTPYNKAWPLPEYRLYHINAQNDSVLLVRTINTEHTFAKPLVKGSYRLVVVAASPTDERSSRSNDLLFEVDIKDIVIYNVLTPNGDGSNDLFKIENLHYYPGAQVYLYNRWGQEVFYAVDYQNDWSPTELSAGNYIYKIILPNQQQYEGSLRIMK
jgi:gliding motility-associated-like protein